jgi:hypothetical protein
VTFFLGVHRPHWLNSLDVPLFISRRHLASRKSLPRALTTWAVDSGGFTELGMFGEWTVSPRQYAGEVSRFAAEIGKLAWAPALDWMCEPAIRARTGLSTAEHQRRTVQSYLDLCQIAPERSWVPVLQGWAQEDYLRHWEAYEAAGVDLAALPLVGVGSVCRRQHTREAAQIVRSLSPLRLHLFGFKTTGLLEVADGCVSADSMAWSANARRHPALPACRARHKNCANCSIWALAWRARLLDRLATRPPGHQLALAL